MMVKVILVKFIKMIGKILSVGFSLMRLREFLSKCLSTGQTQRVQQITMLVYESFFLKY